jgi:toxin ParE1/3/4
MNVRLAEAAVAELEQVADRIAETNPARALRVFAEIRAACEGLADMPERFQLVPRYEHTQIRRRVHGEYLIFYRVADEAVDILHILHGAMDYERFLFED